MTPLKRLIALAALLITVALAGTSAHADALCARAELLDTVQKACVALP